MKQLLTVGAILALFFGTTTADAKKLDTKGRNYWTVEFKTVSKSKFPLLGDYMLSLESDAGSILLQPGEIGKLHRNNSSKVKVKLGYEDVKVLFGLGGAKHHIYKAKFDTKKHYITIKVVKNPWKLWLTPKLKISGDKKNDGFEQRAVTRSNELRAEWNRKFKRGCTNPKACEKMRNLKRKIKNLG